MTQQAMFSKTGSSDFPSFLKCMITGPPKSGKTTLLGTVPNILVLDTEPHANNLQSIAHLDVPFKAIRSTDDLRQAQFILSQDSFRQQAAQALGLPDIEAVAIDTVDTLQGIMKKERMRDQRSTTQFQRDDWGWLKEEMTSILESFLSLPMHVFLIVHTKTKDIGTEKNPRTVVLPGLEGAIAEQIAGMVGYSLLSYRTEEIRPDGSTKFTKYWLRAEGNETYEFLGNRAAGRLPDIIEPEFKTLLAAAMAGRPTAQHQQVGIDLSGLQTTGQIQQPQRQVAQNPGQPAPQQQQQAPAPAQQQAPAQPTGTPASLPADDEPVNAAAIGHVKKVYDAIGSVFPQEKIEALNLGQARNIVRAFKAAQMDAAEGKLPEGQDPTSFMVEYLGSQGWLPDANTPAPAPAKVVEPKVDGTIDEVKAYVGDDLARANEAFELERTGKNRTSLMSWLESKGASHGGGQVQTPVQTPEPTPAAPAAEQPTPEPAPEPAAWQPEQPVQEPVSTPDAGVTPDAPTADAPSNEGQQQATPEALIQEQLGGQVISDEINANAQCDECKNQIDDVDLAQLGRSRFGKILCVADYIAETKKPRG